MLLAHTTPPLLLLATAFIATGAGCRQPASQSPDGGATEDDAGALPCTVQAPTVCPDPPPHWPDVSPIFQRRCVTCHNGMIGGPWPLMQYSHVADWYDVVRAMLLDCSMPPPDAGVEMPDEERVAILTWLRCGYPE
jgi:hypothetical protein